ncbi:MAG: 30S ribosomal protein S8 [bacterium]|nr:30S ribosomal protein S8 [bacterium]
MITDPIADMLTIIRNGYLARLKQVKIPTSKLKVSLAEVLKSQEWVTDYSTEERTLTVKLRYVTAPGSLAKVPAMTGIQRLSRPSLRLYKDSAKIPRVLGGLGMIILSTSKGLMTGRDAKKQNIGGELICKIW